MMALVDTTVWIDFFSGRPLTHVASVAIENGIHLLHNDKDFRPIEKHCGLKVYHP